MRSYEKNTSILCPIKLDLCVENTSSMGQIKIIEPIHILLLDTIRALNASGDDPENYSLMGESISRFRKNIKSLVLRLSDASLEDFELDKTSSFDPATHVGQRNTQNVSLLLSLYEVRHLSINHHFNSKKTRTHTHRFLLNMNIL